MSAVAHVQPRVGHGPRLHIDLAAIAANTRLFAATTPGALMAVVKADGFGHGAAEVARTALANGASWLGVTSIDEALALRRAGLRVPTLSWLNPLDADFGAAIASGIDLAVPSRDHLEAITRSGIGARVHLQLDTGMARDGAAPEDWAGLCRMARRAERAGPVRVVGVMGHLGVRRRARRPRQLLGRARFSWGVDRAREAGLRPPLRHLAATAATLTDPLSHHTLSRVGAGLVGIDPSHTTELRPAMTLTAPVVGVRRVRPGTSVGYGHSWSRPGGRTWPCSPSGTPTGCRALPWPRRGAARADGAGRSSDGSRWTRWSSTSVTTRPSRARRPSSSARAVRRADRGRVGGLGRHHRARDRHRHRCPGGPMRRDERTPGSRDRWGRQLRARRVAGLRRRRSARRSIPTATTWWR